MFSGQTFMKDGEHPSYQMKQWQHQNEEAVKAFLEPKTPFSGGARIEPQGRSPVLLPPLATSSLLPPPQNPREGLGGAQRGF
jgi:hypothetical protein